MNPNENNVIEMPFSMHKNSKDKYETRPRRKKKKRTKSSFTGLPGMNVAIAESNHQDNEIYPDDKNDFYFNEELLDGQQLLNDEESFIFLPEPLETLPYQEGLKNLVYEAELVNDVQHAVENAQAYLIDSQLKADEGSPEEEKDMRIEAESVKDDQDTEEVEHERFIGGQLAVHRAYPVGEKDLEIEDELVGAHQDGKEEQQGPFIEAQSIMDNRHPLGEKEFDSEVELVGAHQDAKENLQGHSNDAQLVAHHEYPDEAKDFGLEDSLLADCEFAENGDDSLIQEMDFDEEHFQESQEPGLTQRQESNHYFRKPKIEAPVLIAQPDIDIDLVKNINIPESISSIVDVHWRVRIINSQLIVPTRHFFADGVLIADIQYMSNDQPGDLCITTVNIPWKKVIKVDFIYPPALPVECQKREYNFKPNDEELEGAFHREQIISHSQHSISNLNLTRVVSTEHIQTEKQICMELNATLSFNILQFQLVDVCC